MKKRVTWITLGLLCPPLAAILSFLAATASVPVGDGLWGHFCLALVWYVFAYCKYLAPWAGAAGAATAVWAAALPPRGRWGWVGFGSLAAAHLALAGLCSLVFHALMSV